MKRRGVRTKIIATLGPASSEEAVLRKMYEAGLDVVRLNFSHGTHEEHLARINHIRRLNKKRRRHIRIMQDLEGYRIRIGRLKAPFDLKKRSRLFLTQREIEGDGQLVPFDYRGDLRGIRAGRFIYVDDGKIVLRVEGHRRTSIVVRVIVGGTLRPHKGVNIPGARLKFSALTEKDAKDVRVAVRHRLDYVAQSFVRDAQDIKRLKGLLLPGHPSCELFAKIENREALRNLDEIIDEADGIIVARGDLGICVPIYEVPVIQKHIVARCRKKGKPVVVATQMLDSMTEEPLPTRAEVCDVANAILDGATHLMLSQETAIGRHPATVVGMMNKVIQYTERYEKTIR